MNNTNNSNIKNNIKSNSKSNKKNNNGNNGQQFKICVRGFMDGFKNRSEDYSINASMKPSYNKCYQFGKTCLTDGTCVENKNESIDNIKEQLKQLFNNNPNFNNKYPELYSLISSQVQPSAPPMNNNTKNKNNNNNKNNKNKNNTKNNTKKYPELHETGLNMTPSVQNTKLNNN